MGRRLSVGVGLSLGTLLAVPAAAQAEDFEVTSLNDSGPDTLRQAIEDANADTGADRVLFSSKLSGTIVLSDNLSISEPIEILGPGARRVTVSGEGLSRAFFVDTDPGEDVTISGLTLADGFGGLLLFTDGGAIKSFGADLTLSGVAVTGSVGSPGGGISVINGSLDVFSSAISGNESSSAGGGIYSAAAPVSILNSTISGNTADEGGGLLSSNGEVELVNSTVARNTASDSAGGIFDSYADTIVRGTIVADNSAPTHPDFTNTLDAAFSLIENVSGAGNVDETVPGSNLIGVDPKLKPLKDNGGPTDTHAFKKSPAKNKIPKGQTPKSDQRGAKRKGKGDIGAYELVKCEGVIVNRVGTAKKDKLKGTKRNDGILGLGGNDKLAGKKGKDGLCGGKGKDKLKGGPGKDKLDGGPGKDKEIQ
jgi:putative cofactor-binding repeat protein